MASLDGRIREALRSTVAASATGAKSVVTYQDSAFSTEDDLPAILVEVGVWTQALAGSGSIPGQRAYVRTYPIQVAVIVNTQRKSFFETANVLMDQALAALSRWREIPTVHFTDLSVSNAFVDRYPSEDGFQGQLCFEGTCEVLLNEAQPDVAVDPDADPVSAFPLYPGVL